MGLTLVQHLLHVFNDLLLPFFGCLAAVVEPLEDDAQGLRCILGDLLVILRVGRADLREILQNLKQFVPLDMEENEIFGSILCKSLQIVADFELHSFLLHGGRLEDPQTHSLQADPAQQEVIGDLDYQGAMYALYLHEVVQKQLNDPGLTKGEVDVVRNFLIFARSCGQDSQNKQGNSIVGVVGVIAEGQHQLRVVAEISYRAQAELERFLEGLKRVLKAEVGSLGDDPSHAILKHLRSAEPDFREGVDEPSPLVIVAEFPLYLIEELGGEEAVDDEVAEMRNGHSHILIDHFHDDL